MPIDPQHLRNIGLSNRELLEINLKRRLDFRHKPELIYPWWRRCAVKVLLVTDGGLNFGPGDFGLSTFVHVLLNDAPSRVKFDLTLAHLREGVTDAEVMMGQPGISKSIKGFRFDEPTHFTPEMYDQIWLFGIATSFGAEYQYRSANQYPANRLSDGELSNISAHMNRGGGVFATGDHGFLGRALCGSLPRVRGMRHWADFPDSIDENNEVSMGGRRRNDTNRVGHDVGTQFSDQSDDIPQLLDLKLYSTYVSFLRRARYPHPVLCGRTGRIDVLPDHPHEGECRVPGNLNETFPQDGSVEYPSSPGGLQIVPEVIAFSHVPAGNTADKAGSKAATIAHSFGAISAYDGHRAGVGRVICDATWHHFVNVNLIGVVEGGGFDQFDFLGGDHHPGEHASKHDGFLSSPYGQGVLDQIKNYYTNIGVWISPPARQRCFNRFAWWQLVYADRIMEAALIDPDVALEQIPVSTLLSIGIHARDAFGRRASQCQTIEWLLDWIIDVAPMLVEWIDPWEPLTQLRLEKEASGPLPMVDPMPLVDVALGAALVAMRQAFPYPPERMSARQDEAAFEAAMDGARTGFRRAAREGVHLCQSLTSILA
ncbi:hypothetical protein DCC79_03110 [bacterium]|nr:hypothetical protein [Chloroflexi bacterium CFX6]RIL11952.1 MAG: hypothetical protein DCC79_03110 [bacterium]